MTSTPALTTRLERFFSPRHVAIVGASDASNWTRNLVSNMGDACRVTPVHPRHANVLGHRAAPSLAAIDGDTPVDMAFVVTSSARVPGVLEDAASAGVRNVVVLASDYDDDGAQSDEQRTRLREQVESLGITLLGPNTVGFINAPLGLAPWASVIDGPPLAGGVGAAFESGSIARSCIEFAQAHGIGSTVWAAMGNAAATSTMDVVEYLVDHEPTRVIALFLESVREPERLIRLSRLAAERGKPVVVLKSGRTEVGQRAAMAHTGAVASDDVVVDAVFRQHGLVRTHSIEELVTTAGLLASTDRRPRGRRMGVVTSSGGGCNLIADLADEHGVELPDWEPGTVERLREVLPEEVPTFNPLDTTGFGHSRPRPRPTKAEDDLLEIAGTDGGMDLMYSMMTPLPAERPDDPAFIEARLEIVGQIVRDCPLPVFLSSNTCLDLTPYQQHLLSANDLFLLPGAHLGMLAIRNMLDWQRWRDRHLEEPALTTTATVEDVVVRDGAWSEAQGRDLLAGYDVPVVPALLAADGVAADAAAAELRADELVVKVCSADLPHKSDVGGVRLGVSPSDVGSVTTRMLEVVASARPEAVLDGVLVSPMRPEGLDLLVGVTLDDTFGPVLAVGLGGVWVEVMKDVSLRALPVTTQTVREMLEELRGFPLLQGARGSAPVDLDAAVDVILGIARAATDLGDRLDSLEVNPLRAGRDIEVLDVLVVTRAVADAATPRPASTTGGAS